MGSLNDEFCLNSDTGQRQSCCSCITCLQIAVHLWQCTPPRDVPGVQRPAPLECTLATDGLRVQLLALLT